MGDFSSIAIFLNRSAKNHEIENALGAGNTQRIKKIPNKDLWIFHSVASIPFHYSFLETKKTSSLCKKPNKKEQTFFSFKHIWVFSFVSCFVRHKLTKLTKADEEVEEKTTETIGWTSIRRDSYSEIHWFCAEKVCD